MVGKGSLHKKNITFVTSRLTPLHISHLLLVNFPHVSDHFPDAERCSHAVSGELEFLQTRVTFLFAAVSISPSSNFSISGFFANLIKALKGYRFEE